MNKMEGVGEEERMKLGDKVKKNEWNKESRWRRRNEI